MKIPTDDQLAKIRFAYRVYSSGSTYGAPASTVIAANELIAAIGLNHHIGRQKTSQEFKALAVKSFEN